MRKTPLNSFEDLRHSSGANPRTSFTHLGVGPSPRSYGSWSSCPRSRSSQLNHPMACTACCLMPRGSSEGCPLGDRRPCLLECSASDHSVKTPEPFECSVAPKSLASPSLVPSDDRRSHTWMSLAVDGNHHPVHAHFGREQLSLLALLTVD